MNYKDFNGIVFTGNKTIGNGGFITYRKQSSLKRFISFLNSKYTDWRWVTVYDRKTNEKEVIKNINDSKKNGNILQGAVATLPFVFILFASF